MPKQTKKQSNKPVTTAQKLGSAIKSSRDIMRKDKGLNGELDRLPQLTWIMFLKLLDDSEKLREVEAELEGISYKQTIQPPYRWRDWAVNENFTGDGLKNFVNNDEAIQPDGERGEGLLAYLRNLKSKTGRDRADVIAKVFKDVTNRMTSGVLFWDVLNKVNEIHFDKSEEVNLLSTLYESMLKEMRDAAGDSGEFYTPRSVVRFMVKAIAPKLGETIFDPACGTGGFLVEVYEYLKLPNGVFAPYTSIPTNILFFDRSQATEEIWYYEIPLPEGRKTYTKTKPIQDEEFSECLAWWNKREENEYAWKYDFREAYEKAKAETQPHWDAAKDAEVKANECAKSAKEFEGKIQSLQNMILDFTPAQEKKAIEKQIKAVKSELKGVQAEEKIQRELAKEEQGKGDAIYWAIYNLDRKNPNSQQEFEHLPPEQLLADILQKDRRVAEIMAEIQGILED